MGVSGVSDLFRFGAPRPTVTRTAHVSGSVTNAGSATSAFKGNTAKINMNTLDHGLKTVLSGGACQATVPLTEFSGAFSLSI